MNLKLATLDDLDQVVRLVVTFIRQSPYKNEPYDIDEISTLVETLLRDKNKGIVVLLLNDDVPVGFIGGLITKMLFNKDAIATELFWWVDPQFRGRKALSLKEAFEFWAKRVGARYITMSAPASDARVSRYYERAGYENIENSYLKRVA